MSTAPHITRRQVGGYRLTVVDDGVDYWHIAEQALAGRLPMESLPERDGRQVHFVRHGGRTYVLKTDRRRVGRLDSKLRRLRYGPVYSTAMRRIWKAAARGCDLVQLVYMVAERRRGLFVTEAVILAEYVEGPTLNEVPDPDRYRDDVARLMTSLHGYGLAFVDPNKGNFIVAERGLRVIDLTYADNFRMGRARDYLKIKRIFGFDLPPAGRLNAILMALAGWSRGFRLWLRRARGKDNTR